jgi:hypothetical protein
MKLNYFLVLIALLTNLVNTSAQNFADNVASIIFNHCSNCHRPGEIGPFSLTNYEEAKDWGQTIKHVTQSKYMPPWKPDPAYRNYQHENFLSDAEISTITKWVDSGMPEGDPSKTPAFPNFPKGSQIGTPDLTLSFATKYTHKGNFRDEYRYFVLPTNLTEDKDLIALEMRPGNTKVVHHTLFWADATGKARVADAATPEYGFEGGVQSVLLGDQLPGYVPGQKPNVYNNKMGQKITKGSDLVLQMHYAPTGVDETDSSSVNLFFAKTPAQRVVRNYIMLPNALVNGPFEIQPGEVKEFHGVFKVPFKVSLLGIWPHCHMLGKKWEVYATTPTGEKINLIKISDWDFNWQGGYYFKNLVVLPTGSEIHAFATYDNTVDNPVNPNNPPKKIAWGEGTSDEMFYLPLSYVIYAPGDEQIVLNAEDPNFESHGIKNISSKTYPVYPNPVEDQIKFSFTLDKTQEIRIDLCNSEGKLVQVMVENKKFLQGQHIEQLNLKNISTGNYLLRLHTKAGILTEKISKI